MQKKGIVALESGKVFVGTSFGYEGERDGEIVFNTSLSGYQEVLTDPSYCGQIVCMTNPHIGNYGVNTEDMESNGVAASGFVVREASAVVSNWRSTETLAAFLVRNKVVGIEGIDTRALTRHIREAGAMRAIISTTEKNPAVLVARAKKSPGLVGRDLVKEVTCTEKYLFPFETAVPPRYRVALLDCGSKTNIARELSQRGCAVTIFPATAKAADILALEPNGIMLSNGPGDPSALPYVIETVRALINHIATKNQKLPMFGICLGHQMLALALGGTTYKLKFGHRGANHPVKDLTTGAIEITSQNHGFCVSEESLADKNVVATHFNLYDKTLEGFQHKTLPIFAVQYHPEANPGPHDSNYLFDRFLKLIEKSQS